MKTINFFSFLLIIAILFTVSCKIENAPVDPNDLNRRFEKAIVLRDNTSYESVWDTVMQTQGMSQFSIIRVSDFTIDTKNRMNFVFYYDQHAGYATFRRTWDLVNKKMIPQPEGAAKEDKIARKLHEFQSTSDSYELEFEAYKPYTNYYAEGYLTTESSGGIQYNRVYLKGDMSVTPTTFYPLAALELGYENAVGRNAYNTAVIFRGLNKKDNEDFNYKFSNVNLDYAVFQYVKPNVQTYQLLCEARTNGPSVYFGFTQDNTLQAIEFTETGNLGAQTISATNGTITAEIPWKNPYVNWITQNFKYPGYKYNKTIRHYSVDGSIMSFALRNFVDYKYSTFVYNFNTKEFKTVVDNVSLNYGDPNGSDVDIDETGNLYYTGYANNGANKEGISVYKISVGNSTTLVGTDDFLKYGTVVKLKYLHGKIYMAVSGKKSGYDTIHQLSLIKQK